MATNLAIVRNSHPDPVLIRNTQERHIARNGVQRTNLDRLTGTNLDSAQRTITQTRGTRRSHSRSHSRSRSRSRGRQDRLLGWNGSRRCVVVVASAGARHKGKRKQGAKKTPMNLGRIHKFPPCLIRRSTAQPRLARGHTPWPDLKRVARQSADAKRQENNYGISSPTGSPAAGTSRWPCLQAGTQSLAESVRPGITRQTASHLVHDVGKADPVLEVSVGQRTPGTRVAEGLR